MTQAHLTFDDDAVAEAEAALAALAEEYPGYAQADVDEMTRLAGDILDKTSLAAPVFEDVAALFGIVHNVKGQGSSFGYDLMTVFGEALCQMLRDRTDIAPEEAQIVVRLVAACHSVLTERLTGMGGARGASLMDEAGLPAHQR